jgi:hypothetical protein
MTDFDVHPDGYPASLETMPLPVAKVDPRLSRNSQEDLHMAIDLAYSFASAINALHPLAEKQIKGMIFQGNLL